MAWPAAIFGLVLASHAGEKFSELALARECTTRRGVVAEITPEDLARHMANLCSQSCNLPADTAAWLSNAAQAYLRAETKCTFDSCLGLVSHAGDHTWQTKLKREQRNECLRQVRSLLVGNEQHSDYKTAQLLVEAVSTFTTSIWPSWCDLDEPPTDAAEVNRLLFCATKLNGRGLSESWRTLNQAVQEPVVGV